MMDVSLTDDGTDHLAAQGILKPGYLEAEYAAAYAELEPGATLVSAFKRARDAEKEDARGPDD